MEWCNCQVIGKVDSCKSLNGVIEMGDSQGTFMTALVLSEVEEVRGLFKGSSRG